MQAHLQILHGARPDHFRMRLGLRLDVAKSGGSSEVWPARVRVECVPEWFRGGGRLWARCSRGSLWRCGRDSGVLIFTVAHGALVSSQTL